MADVELEFVWSSGDQGDLTIELYQLSNGAPVGLPLAHFEFDEETVLQGFDEDSKSTIENGEDMADVFIEWHLIANRLEDLSEAIRHRLNTFYQ